MIPYKPFTRFIYRVPSLPLQTLQKAGKEEAALLELFSDPLVREAIYIASPTLYEEINKLLNNEVKEEKEKKRILYSFLRYVTRMSSRSTPFGLFAGCGIGQAGEKNQIRLDKSKQTRKTRLDMFYLCMLQEQLFKEETVKKNIRYSVNTSLYPMGNYYRFIESTPEKSKQLYRISEIQKDSYLKKIFRLLKTQRTAGEIIHHLVKEGIDEEDVQEYIYFLIDSKILQSQLSQTVTGEDLLKRLVEIIRKILPAAELTYLLSEINDSVKQLDSQPYDNQLYKTIIHKLEKFRIPFEKATIFQVDMCHAASCATFNHTISKELQSALHFLSKITPHYKDEMMEKFREEFAGRYEDREVSLMEVLDTEMGIGYPAQKKEGDPSPLIDSFPLPPKHTGSLSGYATVQKVLMKKLIEADSGIPEEIVLTDGDFPSSTSLLEKTAPTLACMFKVISCKEDAIRILFNATGGSSAANLLGRFAHLNEEIEDFVKEITKKEQEFMKDKIVAEIVHLPQSSTGNILFRPHLREYELLYLATSDLPEEKTIPVSDLMLSLRNGRLVLRSKKLNREIIPRLTTAHNYRPASLPVYRFLCDLQLQDQQNSLFFNWGELENEIPFRPRVRYKNTILKEAGWTIEGKQLAPFFNIREDKELLQEIEKWRNSLKIPPYTYLTEGDNKLLIDWNSALSVRSLFSIIKNKHSFLLEEFLFDEEHALVKENENTYLNECIVVFHK